MRPLPPQGTPAVGRGWTRLAEVGSTSRVVGLSTRHRNSIPGRFLPRLDVFWTPCCPLRLQRTGRSRPSTRENRDFGQLGAGRRHGHVPQVLPLRGQPVAERRPAALDAQARACRRRKPMRERKAKRPTTTSPRNSLTRRWRLFVRRRNIARAYSMNRQRFPPNERGAEHIAGAAPMRPALEDATKPNASATETTASPHRR
jgi:hypothetical protein